MGTHQTLKLLEQAGQKFGELNPAEKQLFTLAQERFNELSDSEYELFRKIANGERVDYQTKNEIDDKPENAASWGAERILRGDRLRWLCLEPEVWKLCLPQEIDISGARIEGSLNLSFSDAEIPIRFFRCYFAEALRLQQAKLRQLALSGTHIASSEILISSDESPTPTSIYAEGINVTGSIFLSNGFQAKGRVSLLNARIGNTLRIAGVKTPKEMVLNLQFSRVQTLDHCQDSFPGPGNLYLNGLVYEALAGDLQNNSAQHMQWLRLQPKPTFSSQPYEHLAKVLQSTGKGDEAVRVLIGKEKDELRYGKLGWVSKAWESFLGITIAYGYRPQRALFWALLVVLFGTCQFSEGYNKGLLTPTEKDCQSSPPKTPQTCPNNPNYPKFNPFVYSLDVFLPIIDLRLKGAWETNANKTSPNSPNDGIFRLKSGAQLRYYFWFQIMSGWVLTTLWVSGFTGLVRNTNK